MLVAIHAHTSHCSCVLSVLAVPASKIISSVHGGSTILASRSVRSLTLVLNFGEII